MFKSNIEAGTLKNKNYRKVVHTVPGSLQLVYMHLLEGEEIGMEVHEETTQFIRVEAGKGVAIVDGRRFNLKDGDAIIIPYATEHNIIATSDLYLYTVYSKNEHPPGLIQRDKPQYL